MSREWSRLLFLGVVWGAVFPFMRIAAPEIGPLVVAEGRVVIAAAILFVVAHGPILVHLRARPFEFAILGLTYSAIPFTLISTAAVTLSASTSSVLNATTPLFTMLLAALWLHQSLSVRAMAGIAIGLTGVAVIGSGGSSESLLAAAPAILASLGAALSYAFAALWVKRRMPEVPPLAVAGGQLLVGALILAGPAAATLPAQHPSTAAVVSLILLAVVSTALAWPVFFGLLARCGAVAASTITFIVPAFGLLWGAILLGEQLGPEVAVGFTAILASLLLILNAHIHVPAAIRRRLGREPAAPEPEPVPTPTVTTPSAWRPIRLVNG
jgi:drug/metabolite transporter (DMT)-like permease